MGAALLWSLSSYFVSSWPSMSESGAHAAGFADFELLFDLGMMPGCQPDDFIGSWFSVLGSWLPVFGSRNYGP